MSDDSAYPTEDPRQKNEGDQQPEEQPAEVEEGTDSEPRDDDED